MDKRVLVGILIVIIAVLAFVLLQSQSAQQTVPTGKVLLSQANEPIKIGFIVAQNGKDAVAGEESLDGLLLAEKEINSNGGVNGKQLKVVVEDDKSSAAEAVTAFQKLANVDSIQLLIGGQIAEDALAVAPLAEKQKVLFIATTAATDSLNDAGEYVFRFQASNSAHAAKITDAMQKLGYNTIGIFASTTQYCKDMLSFLNPALKEKGISVVANEGHDETSLNYNTQILKVNSAMPQALYVCGHYEDQARLIKQARELGISKQFFAVTTFENPKALEIAGQAAEGVIYTSTTFSCDKAKSFCDAYQKEFGKKATYRSGYLYDALYTLADAINRANSTDASVVKDYLQSSSWNGVIGTVVFDAKGNAQREFALKTIKDKKFVFYNN